MFAENFKIALTQLAASKLRTFLTALGIIIGVSSVIIIMTVGDAMNHMAMDSMGSMGANKFTVYLTIKPDENGNYDYEVRDERDSDKLTQERVDATVEHFRGRLKGASIQEEVTQTDITQGNKTAMVCLMGVNYTGLEQEKLTLLAGSNITESDIDNSRSVALVADRYVNKLYDGDVQAALGQQVEVVVNNRYYIYTIVGVYKGQMTDDLFGGGNMDDMQSNIYVPVTTTARQSGEEASYYNVDFVAETGEDPQALTEEVPEWMNETFYASNDTFMVEGYNMQSYVEELSNMINGIKLAFMAIAAISLLVGGIGVMNIMIVTITERTREIGTRKALGATNNSIRMQFITEAVVVCLIGGIVGIILGVAGGYAITSFLKVPTITSFFGIMGCLLFSMSFGVLFGYLPANKAAKMNPIDALRYE